MNLEEKINKAIVVLSGGMDSTTLLYDVINQGYKTYAIGFDYGQKHKKELDLAKQTCDKLSVDYLVVDLSALNVVAPSALTRDDWDVPEGHYSDDNMKQTVVPNRNMVMLSIATSYAISKGAKDVFYGAHIGDHAIYPDCREVFVDKMREAIKVSDWEPINLHAPYLKIDKGDIAIKGKELNTDYSLTWTCYNGKELACGKCGSCVERLEAFDKAEITDPVKYEVL